jgi:hypothetical protein
MEKKIKTQTNLDNFFKNKSCNSENNSSNLNNISTIKKYFYLSWNNEFRPDFQAIWVDKKPIKINFIEEIKSNYIYNGCSFYLCGYFKDYNDPIYTFPKEKTYKNIFFLKSHLQKSIRKQNDTLAIQTCYHMFKADPVELLRRLSIIMIEDVQIHESYSTIIWLLIVMSNEKKIKFRIKRYMYEWIYGVVYTLCHINEINQISELVEDLIKDNSSDKDQTIIQKLNSYNSLDNSLDNNMCSLLYSIELRISYGGLTGDIKMMNNFINYINRINIKINTTKIQLILIYVKELNIDEIDCSAIDYHTNSNFLEYISKKYPELEIEELKKIIWNHSSGLNYRISKESEYNLEKWNKIKNYVAQTQKYLLNQI